jgi:hypothetical protein
MKFKNLIIVLAVVGALVLTVQYIHQSSKGQIYVTINQATPGLEFRVGGMPLEANCDQEYLFRSDVQYEIYLDDLWCGEGIFEQGIYEDKVQKDGKTYTYKYHMEPKEDTR